jgi:DEAD/DEAH box helicase domain-containing protein
MSQNIVYFDLETKHSADDVGGWSHIDKMGMSIGVTYSTARGDYKIYGEPEVEELIKEIQRADLVVGFNHIRFDYRVLEGYSIFDFSQVPSLDMLIVLNEKLGHRLKLDSIAQATLGCEKSAEGLQALEWYKQGKMAEIAEYCCFDVKITKLVHEYGAAHGHLFYNNRFGNKLKVEVEW